MPIKQFLAELALVFVGALAALFAQAWWSERSDRNDAAASVEAIKAELRDNLDRLAKRLDRHRVQQAFLASSEKTLGEETFAASDLAARAKRVVAEIHKEDRSLGLQLVAYRRAAWDVAVARGHVEHFTADESLRYARAYTLSQEVAAFLRGPMIQESLNRHLWVIDSFARGESMDAMLFARSVRESHAVYKAAEATMLAVHDSLKQALADDPTTATLGAR